MEDFELTYHRFSERSILVQWPHKIDENLLNDVLNFKNHLQNLDIESILYVNNTYNSILISYKFTIDNIYNEFSRLKTHYFERKMENKHESKLWKIPVCYHDDFGIDLDEISVKKGMSKSEIIRIHSQAIYTVFFIGFLPGFLYLGGLDKRLHVQRKKEPRKLVEKGAVGIGNTQTGIYPNSSPGGWQIIGNSPLDFFNPNASQPCFAKSGDKIQFISISKDEYYDIKEKVSQQIYNIQNTIVS